METAGGAKNRTAILYVPAKIAKHMDYLQRMTITVTNLMKERNDLSTR